MPRGKPSPKLAITVDPDVHGRVVAAAAARGVSISAWMTDAPAGRLLGASGTTDVVDATVVCAIRAKAAVMTGDAADIERLSDASRVSVRIILA